MNNSYLLFGTVIGVFLSLSFSDFSCIYPTELSKTLVYETDVDNLSKLVLRPANATTKKSGGGERKQTKLVRPRYYSTELGIREKLFVAVLTSEQNIETRAVHINRTVTHIVDQVKFFITARQNVKNRANLTGVVGFTDTRRVYRPFEVIKYIGDSFLQDYDYYYLMHDYSYLHARKLRDVVGKISVSLNVYMGTPAADGSYCDLSAGIVFSNSVMKAMRDNLDWCVRNAVSEDDGENLGRCVHHGARIGCQSAVQEQSIEAYKLHHFELENHLASLAKTRAFDGAVTVYPIVKSNDFYLLHSYYSSRRLHAVKSEMLRLSRQLTEEWPPGQRPGTKPATRFDVPPKMYFNMTHVFFPDDFTNLRKHTAAENDDFENVVGSVVRKVLHENPDDFQYSRLLNGYRTFQLSRGMDYELDLAFRDLHTGKEVVKRFEVCKPLSQVEFLTKPYVTENRRVTLLVPVQQHTIGEALGFIDRFVSDVMEKREKAVLMLVLLYKYDMSSKGSDDIYRGVKDEAVRVSDRYHSEDTKIVWVSVRLPLLQRDVKLEELPALEFGIVDLSLRKVGLENLVLMMSVYGEVSVEFLNRVRAFRGHGFAVALYFSSSS